MDIFRKNFINKCVEKIIIDKDSEIVILKGDNLANDIYNTELLVRDETGYHICNVYLQMKKQYSTVGLVNVDFDVERVMNDSCAGGPEMEDVPLIGFDNFIDNYMKKVYVVYNFKTFTKEIISNFFSIDEYIRLVFKKFVKRNGTCDLTIHNSYDIEKIDEENEIEKTKNTLLEADADEDNDEEYIIEINDKYLVNGSRDTTILKRKSMTKTLFDTVVYLRDNTQLMITYDKICSMF